eukprot:1306575-Amphidinium_carterae.1
MFIHRSCKTREQFIKSIMCIAWGTLGVNVEGDGATVQEFWDWIVIPFKTTKPKPNMKTCYMRKQNKQLKTYYKCVVLCQESERDPPQQQLSKSLSNHRWALLSGYCPCGIDAFDGGLSSGCTRAPLGAS